MVLICIYTNVFKLWFLIVWPRFWPSWPISKVITRVTLGKMTLIRCVRRFLACLFSAIGPIQVHQTRMSGELGQILLKQFVVKYRTTIGHDQKCFGYGENFKRLELPKSYLAQKWPKLSFLEITWNSPSQSYWLVWENHSVSITLEKDNEFNFRKRIVRNSDVHYF